MEIIQAGDRVFTFADKFAKSAQSMLETPGFGDSPADGIVLAYNVQMMGSMWQLASSLMKDITEPLKSIVNK